MRPGALTDRLELPESIAGAFDVATDCPAIGQRRVELPGLNAYDVLGTSWRRPRPRLRPGVAPHGERNRS